MYNENLIGKKFNRLTVVEYSNKRTKTRDRRWTCLCECGKTKKDVRQSHLKDGRVKSCGCLPTEKGNRSPHWMGYGEISLLAWNKLKRDAKKRNMVFNLTIEDAWELFLKQNRKCTYTGMLLTFPTTSCSYNGIASLDRIDSSIGYVIGNVQWIHKWVNIMKTDLTEDEFFGFCKMICEHKKL